MSNLDTPMFILVFCDVGRLDQKCDVELQEFRTLHMPCARFGEVLAPVLRATVN
jgi:hypothetical protein